MSDLFDQPFEDDLESDLEPAPPAPVRRVFSVTELTRSITDQLETRFFEIWVEGELSNCRAHTAGHLFFKLKDDHAVVKGFMFASTVRYLKFKPVDGLRVVARGKISVYPKNGEYQIVCEHLEPQGLGALQLAFEQLKKRLRAEGLFETARKRALPTLPRCIGLVTSLEGAALHDMLKVLGRRHRGVRIVIRPTRVQGHGAASDIARALKSVARVPDVDVIIVGRGGGSIEDLWAFNEEVVARAIAASPVPVIAAVGHQTDTTIADYVADRSAPTPSAAAEIVVNAKDEFCARIDRLEGRLTAAVRGHLQRCGRRVHIASGRPAFAGFPARLALRGRDTDDFAHALRRLAHEVLGRRARRLVHLRRQLDTYDLGRRLGGIRTRLVGANGRLAGAVERRQHRARLQLRESVGRLESLSPLAVLGRGYAVTWNADRTQVIRSADSVQVGDEIHVTLASGALDCNVRAKSS